jgi:hypothetical protein
MDLVSRELIEFCRCKINLKIENYKCALSWWHKLKNEFPTIAIIAQHILCILASQIETKKLFFMLVAF